MTRTSLALPLRLAGDQILDASGVSIALLRGEMAEYRARGAEIVVAVNAQPDLIVAAKEAWIAYNFGISSPYKMKNAFAHLTAAIARAEQA